MITNTLLKNNTTINRVFKNDNSHYMDNLTSLHNRESFNYYIDDMISNNTNFTLFYIDIDNFRFINNVKGHNVGDEVIKELGNRFKELDKDIFIARPGGDEFFIIYHNINKNIVSSFLNRIIHKINNPMIISNQKINIKASIGISQYPIDGNSREEIVKYAEIAMYESKNCKETYKFFDNDMIESFTKNIKLENEIKQAIENREFILHFHPQINVITGHITGVETLIRWNHPDGLKYPDYFIDYLESSEYIIPVGYIIIEKAAEAASRFHNEDLGIKSVAINISANQLEDVEFIKNVMYILDKYNCKPEWLEFEVTERSIIHDLDNVIDILEQLRNLGFKISMDDFGTGYSSLSIIKQLPLTTLKIDKSFIDKIVTDKSIARFIVLLGKEMKLTVIAEGVENEYQLRELTKIGCDMVQGYYYTKPLGEEEFIEFVKFYSSNFEHSLYL